MSASNNDKLISNIKCKICDECDEQDFDYEKCNGCNKIKYPCHINIYRNKIIFTVLSDPEKNITYNFDSLDQLEIRRLGVAEGMGRDLCYARFIVNNEKLSVIAIEEPYYFETKSRLEDFKKGLPDDVVSKDVIPSQDTIEEGLPNTEINIAKGNSGSNAGILSWFRNTSLLSKLLILGFIILVAGVVGSNIWTSTVKAESDFSAIKTEMANSNYVTAKTLAQSYLTSFPSSKNATEVKDLLQVAESEILFSKIKSEISKSNYADASTDIFFFKTNYSTSAHIQEVNSLSPIVQDKLDQLKAAAEKAAIERADAIAKQRAEEEADAKALAKTQGVRIGMTKQQVLDSSWGKPQHVNTTTNQYATHEQWVYGGNNYLYFDNGILTAIQN